MTMTSKHLDEISFEIAQRYLPGPKKLWIGTVGWEQHQEQHDTESELYLLAEEGEVEEEEAGEAEAGEELLGQVEEVLLVEYFGELKVAVVRHHHFSGHKRAKLWQLVLVHAQEHLTTSMIEFSLDLRAYLLLLLGCERSNRLAQRATEQQHIRTVAAYPVL